MKTDRENVQENRMQWFNSEEFREAYHYDGPLGAFCGDEGTSFFVWAPTAEQVVLRLYPDGTDSAMILSCRMNRQERGVFGYRFEDNLDGTYYDYAVTVDGEERQTADPCAIACGINGQRSMVLDLRRTDPPGWEDDHAPAVPDENIIYEIHVRDFSDSEYSGIRPEWRGKYLALTEEKTTLDQDGVHPTGLDYLKYLGVTYIQLMPSFDYGSVDEKYPKERYNWGYDPVNYNIPEGVYSTDPEHGEVRIREMKQAVQALHKNGFRVIMDVVYNHTYSLDSWLFRTVPWYYYRQNPDGSPSNGSGCGNDLASERSMCGKYIFDSVLYWAREYHIDGFRFDLMGLMDVPLMNKIRMELDNIYGKDEKILFGEPWAAGPTAAVPGTILADKGNLVRLEGAVGAFCDATRDAIKGNLWEVTSKGMANGGGLYEPVLQSCLEGWIRPDSEFSVRSPSQTISYVSSHDDWTLWDKLVYSMMPEPDFDTVNPEIERANRLAAALLFSCRGSLFLLSGEEFARTKQGVKNSYNSPINLNRLDWKRAWENQGLVDYYRGLIALRKKIPVLTSKNMDGSYGRIAIHRLTDDCCRAELRDLNARACWRDLVLYVNTGDGEAEVELPETKAGWQPLFNGTDSFLWEDESGSVSGTVIVAPKSVASWAKRSE